MQQKDSWGSPTEDQQGEQTFPLCRFFSGQFCSNSSEFLHFFLSQDGAFLIRHSSGQNTWQPFTLAVLYQQKVYNIPIRFLEEIQGYVLGKEGKKNEEVREKYAGEEQSKEGLLFNLTTHLLHHSLSGFWQPWRDDFSPQASPAASDRQQEPGQAQSLFNPPSTPLKWYCQEPLLCCHHELHKENHTLWTFLGML